MKRDEIIARLKQTEPALRRLGVGALYLFGSHARDEAREDSDVDVFIDTESGKPMRFSPYMDALAVIQNTLDVRVDYCTRNGLHPMLRADIEREAIRVF